MSDLWWLQPGWKSATCPHCGVNIWDTGGDPDWGECYECKVRRHAEERMPELMCDVCNNYPAVAAVGTMGVCSQDCHNRAEAAHRAVEEAGAGE